MSLAVTQMFFSILKLNFKQISIKSYCNRTLVAIISLPPASQSKILADIGVHSGELLRLCLLNKQC